LLNLVLLFALVTLAIMAEAGHRGGDQSRRDPPGDGRNLPTDPNTGISTSLKQS
jgi:hypothetical protein